MISCQAVAQSVLVNGGFEEFKSCPRGPNDIYLATGWLTYDGTPDYYNSCYSYGENLFSTPRNYQGYREPASGKAYAGINMLFNRSNFLNKRECYLSNEMMYAKINAFKISGKPVMVNFSIALSDSSVLQADSVYIFFFNDLPKKRSFLPKDVYVKGIKLDNNREWQKVAISVIIDSRYTYFGIGLPREKYSYKKYDEYISKLSLSRNRENMAYYYIDDVSIETTSSTLSR